MEVEMVCKIALDKRMVLVSHHPISVFATTADHIDRLKTKPDGHYDRKDLMALVDQGHAVMYDEHAVRAVLAAAPNLLFGCPPRA
jgi:hypothetical protein